jgi:hypothetical protein
MRDLGRDIALMMKRLGRVRENVLNSLLMSILINFIIPCLSSEPSTGEGDLIANHVTICVHTSILCFLMTGRMPTGTGVIGPSGVLTGSISAGRKHVPLVT